MHEIKVYQRISLKLPTMLAAWPGMGNVAMGAIDYLRRNLGMQPFAEIEMDELVTPEMVMIEKGVTLWPALPKSVFYFSKQANLIVFESEAQLSDLEGISLMERVLDVAQDMRVKRIYTAAAFPVPITCTEPSQVFGVANKNYLLEFIKGYGVKIMEGGQISGLNGLLLGYAERRRLDAICLLASLPLYAINFPNPKASKAIIEALEKMLDIRVNTEELDMAVYEMEQKMGMIEEKIKEAFPGIQGEGKIPSQEREAVPGYIMEKIERLFNEVKLDKKKAYTLKEELDRWDLYKLYEDRFLDLFRKGNNQ